MRALALILAGAAGLALGVSASAAPPDPMNPPPKDAADAYARSAWVFVGRIVRVDPDTLGFLSIADVAVERSWKHCQGTPLRVQADGSGGPTYPARVFAPGQRLVFYVKRLPVDPAPRIRVDAYADRAVDPGELEDAAELARHAPCQ